MLRKILWPLGLAALIVVCGGCDVTEPDDDSSPTDDDVADDDDAGDDDAGDDDTSPVELAPTQTVSYTASEERFPNPERGIYRAADIDNGNDLDWVSDDGYTLAFSYVRLDDYRESDIPQGFLDGVAAGLDQARAAGIKVILRFAYNWGPYPDSDPDAPLSWVLTHIDQLTPLLQDHQDVIALVQAGFIGAWGEWHSSTNDLLDHKAEILDALLVALPSTRTTQLRYPPYKEELYGDPIDPADAFDGSDQSRVGHHNDCFLASDGDWGTYPGDAIETWKQYVEDDTHFTMMGGETCNPNPPRSECPTALEEMERFHYTFINRDYHQDVYDSWVDGGCIDEIDRRLGYRLTLLEADVPPTARPGGRFQLRLTLHNHGWAPVINPREALLVLRGPGGEYQAALPDDPRHWAPGENSLVEGQVWLPAAAAAGSYSLSLWLPDPAAALRDHPEYAIQLANTGVWDDATGENLLGTIELDPQGPGDSVAEQEFGFVGD